MLIKILLPLILLFLVNLALYFSSEDYRFFVKKIKNTDEVVYVKEKKISDEEKDIALTSATTIEIKEIDLPEKKSDNDLITDKKSEQETISSGSNLTVEPKKEIVLGKKYTEVLDLFSKYELGQLELNSKLFDITDEYPDKYIEYFSSDLTLYFFPTKSYEDMKDIFTVLKHDLPFSLNEVNNFGTNSFYINLDDNISDGRIRLVIGHESIIFGLKIKKDSYNDVKDILEKLNQVKPTI